MSGRFIQSLFTSAIWWLGVAMSFGFYLLVAKMVEDKNEAQFDYQTINSQLAIQARVRSYIDVLRGVSALFYAYDHVTREQFHGYVKNLNLEQSFPGMRSLNFAPRVFAHEKKAFESSVRADTSLDPDGHPGFTIKPPGERSEYHVLTYLEPMDSTNRTAFGFDMASNKLIANHFGVARDNGQLASSGRLIRISGHEQIVALAMRIPIYRRGMPLNTVTERRAAFYGTVGAGFDVNALMLGAVDKETLRYMRIKLYDAGQNNERRESGETDPARLLFDSDVAREDKSAASAPAMPADLFVKRISMTVGPHLWDAEFSADKIAMLDGFDACLPWFALAGGLLASLLFYTYYFLISTRKQALELANDKAKDLRTSEANLAEAQHIARLGSWTLEPVSGKMTWSHESYRIFGLDHVLAERQYDDFLGRIHEEDRQRIREGLSRSIDSGEEFNTEYRIMQHDGSIRWVHTISRLSHSGRDMLLHGTVMDVTESKHNVEALTRSQDLLRELTVHHDRVKEDERKRIAREIHDELGQPLLALRIDVSMLAARTGKSHPKLNEKVRGALSHIDATVKTIRTIINNLRPAVLDLGLTAAIEWQVAEFRRRTGISCELLMDEQAFTVDDIRATSLFRILQESLTNVIRHANASLVVIKLHRDYDRLVMTITDNGIGIYPGTRKAGNSFGLVGVEERIHALSGEFLITSAPGEGTTLAIFIPLEASGSTLNSLNLVDSEE